MSLSDNINFNAFIIHWLHNAIQKGDTQIFDRGFYSRCPRLFMPNKILFSKPSLMFSGKAWACPSEASDVLPGTNTLAYLTKKKKFIL
jgi:hypothetical protein